MARKWDIGKFSGLTQKEADVRLAKEGFNELPSARQRSIFAIAFEVIREPMFLLLVACGGIYLGLGELSDALMLLGFVFVVMGITLYQERKTERALEALRDLSSPRALVIRDGAEKRIAGREVVRGDYLVLVEGDRVPADSVLEYCSNFATDESLLTGESAAVRKTKWDGKMEMARPGGDDLPFIYSGTLVVSGQGIARVLKIGIDTEMGKIGKALQTIDAEPTPLRKETGKIVRDMTIVGLILCTIVIIVYGLTHHDWAKGFLAGLTLAMSILPEEFPMVMTIFLALGAWRISRHRVLTRKVPAVETLGSATVLCVDKTGTLTLNRMSVSQIYTDGEFYDVSHHKKDGLPEKFHELVEFSILASQRDPFDPMEKALRKLGELNLANTEHLHDDWTLVQEYPLSHELLALSHVWKSPDGMDYSIAAKGAPEAVADLCHFNKEQLAELSQRVTQMADAGLRVLGVARANFQKQNNLPSGQHDFVFKFIGLVGFADPVRPGVADSIKECYDAGIRVIMITGDYPGTARNIARQIGLSHADEVLTGIELDHMNDADLQERLRKNLNIFARVVPEQKLRLVQALKANGEVVAMTGDGVNDAPALKAANIGIAMGGRGTDVAREAADLVLVDDDFSSIVQAVKMGRRIFDNLKKAMSYIFAIHVPIAGMSLLPVLFKWPLVLLPVHIVFLELIIDPACSVVFEAEPGEADIMKRRPRRLGDSLLGKRTLLLSILQGIVVLFFTLAIYVIAHFWFKHSEDEARALAFTTLIIGNLGLILTNRSWTQTIFGILRSKNDALWWVLGGAILFLGLVLYIPAVKNMFHFTVLHPIDLLICLACGLLSIGWFELFKYYTHRRHIS
jgi:Ca2+-transporting ATPase